ncbi:MAG: terminase large subunit, partial [Lachnospirales bacterium]
LGLRGVFGARKGKDSISNGIDFIQGYKIIIHPKCVNFITDISNYTWKEDRFGRKTNVPVDEGNHLMYSMSNALEGLNKGKIFSWE